MELELFLQLLNFKLFQDKKKFKPLSMLFPVSFCFSDSK